MTRALRLAAAACALACANLVVSQLYGIAVTLLWSGAVTSVILKAVGTMIPLRVRHEGEIVGLDVTQHGEALQ